MGAGIVTVRVGTRLVGIRTDTARTLQRARTLLAAWVDDDCGDIPFALDLHLDVTMVSDTIVTSQVDDGRRGPRPVPQLRFGQTVLARSRSADDVLSALATVLGGLLARQDDTLMWFGFRAVADERTAVLVEAPPMTLSRDRVLERAGIRELVTWTVEVVPGAKPSLRVPPPLTGLDWTGAGLPPVGEDWQTYDLAGIVSFDPSHAGHTDHDDCTAHPPQTSAAVVAHLARRQSAPEWLPLLRTMIDDGLIRMVDSRSALRSSVARLIDRAAEDRS